MSIQSKNNATRDAGQPGYQIVRHDTLFCPCCKVRVPRSHFSCHSGATGGRAGAGKAKARTSEQARAAVNARWALRERRQPVLDALATMPPLSHWPDRSIPFEWADSQVAQFIMGQMEDDDMPEARRIFDAASSAGTIAFDTVTKLWSGTGKAPRSASPTRKPRAKPADSRGIRISPTGTQMLTPEAVRMIRAMAAEGQSNAKIARHFGLRTDSVWAVVKCRTWKNLV